MTEIESPRTPRRILVALDASPHSQAALDMAVRLAMNFEAELVGLFIKDENLLQAAQLPFAEEVRSFTVPPKRLSDRRVQRQLRYQAERAEAALQEAAEQADVPYDFRVEEGKVTRELLKAAQEIDLLALGKTSTASSRRRLGTTCEVILSESPVPVLVLRKTARRRQPILTFYDGSEEAALALHLASELASQDAFLKVLIPAADQAEMTRLRKEVYDHYGHLGPRLQVRPLTQTEIDRLSALAREEGAGLFVLPGGCSPLENTPLQRFLYEIDCPLLVMR